MNPIGESPSKPPTRIEMKTIVLQQKLDKLTTAMRNADLPPYATQAVDLTYGEAMLLWRALALVETVREVVREN